jgi:hypothetical protein
MPPHWDGDARGIVAGEIVTRFEPDAERVTLYRELRALQTELWPLVSDWNRRLVEFARRGR